MGIWKTTPLLLLPVFGPGARADQSQGFLAGAGAVADFKFELEPIWFGAGSFFGK